MSNETSKGATIMDNRQATLDAIMALADKYLNLIEEGRNSLLLRNLANTIEAQWRTDDEWLTEAVQRLCGSRDDLNNLHGQALVRSFRALRKLEIAKLRTCAQELDAGTPQVIGELGEFPRPAPSIDFAMRELEARHEFIDQFREFIAATK